MRPTRWYVLVLVALAAGAAAFAITRSSYDTMPGPPNTGLLWLAVLTIAEFYIAVMTRARLAGRSGTKPINPLVVARFAALAKASSVVGAVFAGGYGGFLAWVARLDSPAATDDTTTAAIGVGLALLLVSTALFLEQVCRVPKRDDDGED
jgi:4-amino-4-deoxy-L-arabinose transferase-like glycosyltransferase